MKITKRYVLSDSTLNTYGYRLLTTGYLKDEFLKNPIGYYMHGTYEFSRDEGVLLKWDDLVIDGDKIIGSPTINMNHARAQRTIDEVNSGFLNAASMGSFVVIEVSNDPKDKIPGQTGPTITKWFNRECSLVDIPGNYNALNLYNKDGKAITLQSLYAMSNLNAIAKAENIDVDAMLTQAFKNKDITIEQRALLKEQKHDPADLVMILNELKKLRIQYLMSLEFNVLDKTGLSQELKEKFEQGYQQKYFVQFGKMPPGTKKDITPSEAEVNRLLQFAVENKTITPGTAEGWKRNFGDNPTKLKQVIEDDLKNRIDYLMGLEWHKLDSRGLLEELKQKYLAGFKSKFKNQFGVEYKG